MKLKIVSDGTPMGTKVMTESGDVIEGVTNICWFQGIHHSPGVEINFDAVPLELTVPGNAEVDISKIVEAFKNVTVTDVRSGLPGRLMGLRGSHVRKINH